MSILQKGILVLQNKKYVIIENVLKAQAILKRHYVRFKVRQRKLLWDL